MGLFTMNAEEKKFYDFGVLVSNMVQSVVAVVGDSQDTAFAHQSITVGKDRRALHIFVAAPHAAAAFELAAAKSFDVQTLNVKGNSHG